MDVKKQKHVAYLVMPAYVGNKYNRSPRFLTELSMTDWARI